MTSTSVSTSALGKLSKAPAKPLFGTRKKARAQRPPRTKTLDLTENSPSPPKANDPPHSLQREEDQTSFLRLDLARGI
ncbi:hypothetical protein LIER_25403 [Lithospermum erythrorhizon]|uniref:Uncharacterized protein n=1 Tax=Lithospermum erythrorhizon TaxID=34254 RepID=A0AAV3R4K9_LITER